MGKKVIKRKIAKKPSKNASAMMMKKPNAAMKPAGMKKY